MKFWIWLKGHWQTVAEVIGAVLGFIFLRDKLQEGLKAKLENQQTQAKDDVLNEKKKGIISQLGEEMLKNKDLRSDLDKAPPSSNWKEVEDFYKNRK